MIQPWKTGGIGFVGAGAVGSALARALHGLGYPVVAVASGSRASAEALAAQLPGCVAVAEAQAVADRCVAVFITTPDSVIAHVAEATRWSRGQDVLHCSGAAPVALLAAARDGGANVGGLHPLQTFPNRSVGAESLRGIAFGVQAEGGLLLRLEGLVAELGSQAVRLADEDRALYHASAVLACGAAAALVGAAADLWRSFGAPQPQADAIRALLPLLRGTTGQLANEGLPGSLTGPVARGDAATVTAHLDALRRHAPETVPVYAALGLAQVPIARARGACSEGAARELTRIFSEALAAERAVTA